MDTNPENTSQRITRKLTDAFSPSLLEVIDESAKHASHSGHRVGGETHFRIKIRSKAFLGLSQVASHRAIYQTLADDMQEGGIHALALHVGPEEDFAK